MTNFIAVIACLLIANADITLTELNDEKQRIQQEIEETRRRLKELESKLGCK